MLGTRITGKRLGIVGMGRIGQAVARRARAFGLQIHYHNRRKVAATIEEELEATYWDSLDQMLARMDIVSINCPHTPATYHLLSARRLKYLRPQAILVNTARGEVIDEVTLTKMLDAGEIAGAGLDVFEHEPAVSSKLTKLALAGKVTLLPHMGSATNEGRNDMGEKVIINVKAFMDGHRRPTACCRACCEHELRGTWEFCRRDHPARRTGCRLIKDLSAIEEHCLGAAYNIAHMTKSRLQAGLLRSFDDVAAT